MSHYTETIGREALPVIPLRGLVVFPGIDTSFEVARPHTVKAVEMALRADGMIYLVTQKDAAEEEPEGKDLFPVGVIARIKQSIKLPDRSYRIITEGLSRGECKNFYRLQSGALTAEVLRKNVHLTPDAESEAARRVLMSALEELAEFLPKFSSELGARLASLDDAGALADHIAANVLRRTDDKLQVLEAFDPKLRAEVALALLEKEKTVAKWEARLAAKVQAHLDDQQREIYLREQLRVIRSELGAEDETDGDDENLLSRIKKADLTDEVRERLLHQAKKLHSMPYGSSEAALISNWIETCLEIPWQVVTEDEVDVEKARRILDRDHDGLEKVKERILEFLAAGKLRGKVQGQILCLVGAPGVGKTSIASSIAEALSRRYVRISLGGVRDEADIRGHRKTYIGAMPGRIVNALIRAESRNPLITLDEIDKLTRDSHGDPASALLEVLDGAQNVAFRDHFVELPLDLSSCVFLATANETDTIPPALLDRMEIIRIAGYTESEKVLIAKHHLIPKQKKEHGLAPAQLRISESALRRIIRSYTREQGVRNLEREIARLCRRAAKEVVDGKARVSVNEKNLTEYLGKEKVLPEKKHAAPRVGVVNGLAWTLNGGEMLQTEALCFAGTGKLEMTGSLGDVMKESVKTALSFLRANSEALGIQDEHFYKNCDLHVHFPEGAVPKDGPSAGVTLVTCLASLLSGRAVRSDVAMTGEVTLHGEVLAIGGLREKVNAALRAGMKTVLIPADNEKDLDEVDPKAREVLRFVPCRTVFDVLREALVNDNESA